MTCFLRLHFLSYIQLEVRFFFSVSVSRTHLICAPFASLRWSPAFTSPFSAVLARLPSTPIVTD